MEVKKVAEDKQILASQHRLYQELQENETAHERILDGQDKYGTSWCEVDLRTDLLEELYDIYNYTILMQMRMFEQPASVVQPNAKQQSVLQTIRWLAQEMIEDVENILPPFEGPTSNEWVRGAVAGGVS